jgi:hypothetical protein
MVEIRFDELITLSAPLRILTHRRYHISSHLNPVQMTRSNCETLRLVFVHWLNSSCFLRAQIVISSQMTPEVVLATLRDLRITASIRAPHGSCSLRGVHELWVSSLFVSRDIRTIAEWTVLAAWNVTVKAFIVRCIDVLVQYAFGFECIITTRVGTVELLVTDCRGSGRYVRSWRFPRG